MNLSDELLSKSGYQADLTSLMAILRRLRAPDGCPWDREQTRDTLKYNLTGEMAEYLDALDNNDTQNMCEELGDVLMNLFFQILVAEEAKEFDLEQVCREINGKLIRRHPHVFGDAKVNDSGDVQLLWQAVKAAEKAAKSAKNETILSNIPHSLSPLQSAEEMQRKAAKVGFDWSNQQEIIAKIKEELAEVEQAIAQESAEEVDMELGDLLFSVVNLIRFRKRLSADQILRNANLKFRRRFNFVESSLKADGKNFSDVTLDQLESCWRQAKANE
ncbi:MAG: nucleoside triphosphate pyrophosphohydrolase [Victivallaceae bacterium]